MRKLLVGLMAVLLFAGCKTRSSPRPAVVTSVLCSDWSGCRTKVQTLDDAVYSRAGTWGEPGDTLLIVVEQDRFPPYVNWDSPGPQELED